jgi:hypothetical protein
MVDKQRLRKLQASVIYRHTQKTSSFAIMPGLSTTAHTVCWQLTSGDVTSPVKP